LNSRRWVLVAAVAAVAILGFFWWRGRVASATPKYRTAEIDRGTIESVVSATGTIEPVEQVQVGSQVSGTVQKINADYNSRVRAGQVILQLEQSSFRARVVQAEAAVAKAQATVRDGQRALDRAQQLFKQNYVSQAELDNAVVTLQQNKADLQQAQAQLQSAQVDLAHTTIRSPIDGVVIARSIDVGQTVAASLQAPQLFLIANDLRQMQVETKIDEADIGQIRPGLPVSFTVDAFPDREFDGQVAQVRLEPITDQNVVTYTTVIRTANPDLRLRPGMTANVTVRIEKREDALRVPNAALRFRPPQTEGRSGGGAFAAGMQGAGGGDNNTGRRGRGGARDSSARGGDPGGAPGGGWPRGQGGGGGGAFAAMSDAQRAAFRERMRNATPEERQRVRDSLMTATAGGGPAGGGSGADLVRRGPATGHALHTAPEPGAGSQIEPPAEPTPYRPGTVYLLVDGKPQRTRVMTGITDGAFTEIQGDGVKAGDRVVLGMDVATRSAGNNLQPPPGMGGFRGPGGGGGGGGRGR
jgi:HlyD family secretion protein